MDDNVVALIVALLLAGGAVRRRRSMMSIIAVGMMSTWRSRLFLKCIKLNHLQRFMSADARGPHPVPSVDGAYRGVNTSLPSTNVPIY